MLLGATAHAAGHGSASTICQSSLLPSRMPTPRPCPPTGPPQHKWTVPRETTALPLHNASGNLLCGISAYAFQGTNAHAIIQRPTQEGGLPSSLPNTSHPAATDWQKEAHWVGPPVHVMLHRVLCTAAGGRKAAAHMECHLSATPRLAFMWDHQVGGRVLFPGAAFFELATAALKQAAGKAGAADAALAGAAIPAPLQLPDRQLLQKAAPVVLRISIRLSSGAVAVASSPGAFKQKHLTAAVSLVATSAAAADATTDEAAQPARSSSTAALLRITAGGSPTPGVAHAAIDNTACDGTSHFHPASLDSCLQLAAAQASSALKVPASLACLHVPARLTAPQLAAASRQQGGSTAADAPSVVDYSLCQAAGGWGLALSSLELKPLGRLPVAAPAGTTEAPPTAPTAAAEELLYEVSWPAAQPAVAVQTSSGVSLVQLQHRSGAIVVAGALAALQTAHPETLGAVQLATGSALCVVPAPTGGSGAATLGSAEGGMPGLMRTLALEYPQQRFASLDTDRLAPAGAATASAQLALLPLGSPTLPADAYGAAQRGGVEQRAALLPAKACSAIPDFHLMPMPRGALGSLKPLPVRTAEVAPGQVLLSVKAVGVNFRCRGGVGLCGH